MLSVEALFSVLQAIEEKLVIARAHKDAEAEQILDAAEDRLRKLLAKRLIS